MIDLKEQFPIFQNNPGLVYLDNAATSQKPKRVIEAEARFYSTSNANVHRGLYQLSEEATDMYESARAKVAKFINAEPEEIIFTSGTTDSLNGLAISLQRSDTIGKDSRILLTELEHHANILPWQQTGAKLDYIPVNAEFTLDTQGLDLSSYDLISYSLVSNVTGTTADLAELIRQSGTTALKVIDAAQAVAHMPIDVQKLGADFIAFSAHKMYGPTGIGVLWGRKQLLDKMEPFRVGGGMIREVSRDHATWAETPTKFEAGTPPIAQAIGLAAAVEFIESMGWKDIQKHEQELSAYAAAQLREVPGLTLYRPQAAGTHGPVFSFSIAGIHPHDIAQTLADNNIAVRAGHHCCQILHRETFKVPATVRASFGIYNTQAEIDKLVAILRSISV